MRERDQNKEANRKNTERKFKRKNNAVEEHIIEISKLKNVKC